MQEQTKHLDSNHVNTSHKEDLIWKEQIRVSLEKGNRVLAAKKKKKSNITATTESLYGRFSSEAVLDAQRQCPRKKEQLQMHFHSTQAVETTQLQQWWKWLNIEYISQKPKPNKNGMPNKANSINWNVMDRPKIYYWIPSVSPRHYHPF